MHHAATYPLRFVPVFQRYLWGGKRLHELLNKECGSESAAESWEIVDHQDIQSAVAFGPWKGRLLNQLLSEFGKEILGESVWRKIHAANVPASLQGRFPLLFKFLDANQALSVQVHPDDHYGATLTPPDLGKTEAWFVMHADPGARIYAGLKSGVNQSDFARAITENRTSDLLHSFEAETGDVVFIPAGTIHALGAGLVIAEIQQASNTTFRVYDWGRVDASGNSRPLHVKQALEVSNFEAGPVNPIRRKSSGFDDNRVCASSEPLIACDEFVLNRIHLHSQAKSIMLGGDQQFHILAVTEGEVMVEGDQAGRTLRRGETILIPASLPVLHVECQTERAELLEIKMERG